jgi:malonyl-CoA O-methyltransferase
MATQLLEQKMTLEESYQQALNWVRRNTLPHKGVVVTSRQRTSYLEVTGYYIPTLMDAGEYELAKQYTEFLASMQRANGSFAGPDGREYIFDSGQALRGLVRASFRWEKFRPFARKTADYLVSSMEDSGCLPAIYTYDIPRAIQVFVLPALVEASQLFNEPRYLQAAQKAVNYYKSLPDILYKNHITHFLAYILDGFIDMGEADFVYETVQEIFAKQKEDGSIPAYPNVNWICSTGVAQFAIIAHKLQMHEERDSAISYLINRQNASGGFFGSYGIFSRYFPREEISWANKFFIDLIHLKKSSV